MVEQRSHCFASRNLALASFRLESALEDVLDEFAKGPAVWRRRATTLGKATSTRVKNHLQDSAGLLAFDDQSL